MDEREPFDCSVEFRGSMGASSLRSDVCFDGEEVAVVMVSAVG